MVESCYIDRHFIEEVALYYSRCLVPKPNSCGRVHVFAAIEGGVLSDRKLTRLIERAAAGDGSLKGAEKKLADSYLGFIVVRPLPSVPIGRTVLRFRGETGDVNHSRIKYTVHFLGFELSVEGLAFQQQDRAVGACATVAVWTALQRLTRHEGARAPTPSEITGAAVRHFVPVGRPFPSPGLTIEQICEALRALDFPPIVLDVKEFPDLFKFRVSVYLRSGMPVILAVKSEAESSGHAVTAVGFRDRPGSDELWSLNGHAAVLKNSGYDRIYISDDRLGPYVPAGVTQTADGKVKLRIDSGVGPAEDLQVLVAVVPLYPKLRMSAFDLFEAAPELVPWIQHLVGEKKIVAEMYFERSGT